MPSNRNSNSSRRHDNRENLDDRFEFNLSTSPGVSRNLGAGDDLVKIRSRDVDQIRITFTSTEVGNGNPNDSNTLANQDGGLAVRVQAEDAAGNLVGPVSRFDDEGITFKANRDALFDVRDLVSGVSRGLFDEVILGTAGNDKLGDDDDDDRRDDSDDDDDDRHDDDDDDDAYYINGGMGNDRIFGGSQNDFLVGGAGNDRLFGRQGDDGFIGGLGDDIIRGGRGNDTATVNIALDGADAVNLGEGLDRVVFTPAAVAGTQIRITFANSGIGNDNPRDAGGGANQDGGLAVRIQLENAAGELVGPVSRYDDEGISFIRGTGQTFDVRELGSGAQRGDQYDVVRFGTSGDDTMSDAGRAIRYYVDGGGGNDTLIGGTLFDALVGGRGDDRLDGRQGNDNLVGGAGSDRFIFSGTTGNDRIIDFAPNIDRIDLSAFGITAANVTSAVVGTTRVLSVDTTFDSIPDFTITLVNGATPLATDYIF